MGEKADLTQLLGVDEIRQNVIGALKRVYDPEIPVNIYELGLIYGVKVDESGVVDIEMTLTTPACPVAQILPVQVKSEVETIPGVKEAHVNIVWDPPWGIEKMSDAARLQLGLM